MSSRVRGILQIIVAAICFGFLGIFGKSAFSKNVEPLELLSLRFLLSGSLMLAGIFLFSKRLQTLRLKHVLLCTLLGVCGYAVFSSFYFLAVKGLSVSLAVLLLYTYPLMVTLGAWIILKEPIPKSKIIGIPACFVGTTFLIWGDFQIQNLTSLLFGIGAAVAYALYILGSGKWLKDIDTLSASAIIQISTGMILFVLGFKSLDRASTVFTEASSEIMGLAVICSILPITLFQSGLKHVKGWEASIFSTLEPVTAIFLGIILLGEGFNSLQGFGTTLVLASLLWVAWPKNS